MKLPLQIRGGIFIEGKTLPVDLVIVRASSVPEFVTNEKALIKAGITGNDILWENGMKDAGSELPIPNNATIFLGVTERLVKATQKESGRDPVVDDLNGNSIVTKFPRIAEDFFREKDIKEVTIFEQAGKTEAIQYIFPDCNGIVDVISSGATVRANRLTVVEKILEPVTVRIIDACEQLTEQDQEILFDFKKKLLEVSKRKT